MLSVYHSVYWIRIHRCNSVIQFSSEGDRVLLFCSLQTYQLYSMNAKRNHVCSQFPTCCRLTYTTHHASPHLPVWSRWAESSSSSDLKVGQVSRSKIDSKHTGRRWGTKNGCLISLTWTTSTTYHKGVEDVDVVNIGRAETEFRKSCMWHANLDDDASVCSAGRILPWQSCLSRPSIPLYHGWVSIQLTNTHEEEHVTRTVSATRGYMAKHHQPISTALRCSVLGWNHRSTTHQSCVHLQSPTNYAYSTMFPSVLNDDISPQNFHLHPLLVFLLCIQRATDIKHLLARRNLVTMSRPAPEVNKEVVMRGGQWYAQVIPFLILFFTTP